MDTPQDEESFRWWPFAYSPKICFVFLLKVRTVNLTSSLGLRVSFYLLFGFAYFVFLGRHVSEGFHWPGFHEERILNAVGNLTNGFRGSLLGLTSWSDPISRPGPNEEIHQSQYLVSSLPYYGYALLSNIFGQQQLPNLGLILDFSMVTSSCVIASELLIDTIEDKENSFKQVYACLAFVLMLVNPWSYRMTIAPWHEMPWLLLILIFYFLSSKQNSAWPLLFLFIAGLVHPIWNFSLFLFYLIQYLRKLLSRNLSEVEYYNAFPRAFRSSVGCRRILMATLCSTLLARSQLYLASLPPLLINHTGSSLLYRIGIDGRDNIHHGGILAALQFLGGNRITVCLQDGFLTLPARIYAFNCSLSIIGLTLISLLALIFFIRWCVDWPSMHWLYIPMAWSLFFQACFLQQSFAVHLQGYSLIFVIIFSAGLVYFFQSIQNKLNLRLHSFLMLVVPATSAIAFNSIKVIYLTGVSG